MLRARQRRARRPAPHRGAARRRAPATHAGRRAARGIAADLERRLHGAARVSTAIGAPNAPTRRRRRCAARASAADSAPSRALAGRLRRRGDGGRALPVAAAIAAPRAKSVGCARLARPPAELGARAVARAATRRRRGVEGARDRRGARRACERGGLVRARSRQCIRLLVGSRATFVVCGCGRRPPRRGAALGHPRRQSRGAARGCGAASGPRRSQAFALAGRLSREKTRAAAITQARGAPRSRSLSISWLAARAMEAEAAGRALGTMLRSDAQKSIGETCSLARVARSPANDGCIGGAMLAFRFRAPSRAADFSYRGRVASHPPADANQISAASMLATSGAPRRRP